MERWSITVQKEYFNFAAAHFLIFPDGSKERLHGHNYRVYVEIEGELSEHGLVIDFKLVKPVVKELLDGEGYTTGVGSTIVKYYIYIYRQKKPIKKNSTFHLIYLVMVITFIRNITRCVDRMK